MTNAENGLVLSKLKHNLASKLPTSIMDKMSFELENNSNALIIETRFLQPHLDVNIELNGGEFVANYNNGHSTEYWFKAKDEWQNISNEIERLLYALIVHGAVEVKRSRKGETYSIKVKIGNGGFTTSLFKLSLMPKSKSTRTYPPVLKLNN